MSSRKVEIKKSVYKELNALDSTEIKLMKGIKTHHCFGDFLDKPMVLFNKVIEAFNL